MFLLNYCYYLDSATSDFIQSLHSVFLEDPLSVFHFLLMIPITSLFCPRTIVFPSHIVPLDTIVIYSSFIRFFSQSIDRYYP